MRSRTTACLCIAFAHAFAAASAAALETATSTDDRASAAAMMRQLSAERADQLAELATLQAYADALKTCNGKGRFYTPGKAGADTDGCTVIAVTVQ